MPDSASTLRELVEKTQLSTSKPKFSEDIRGRIADYVHQQRLLGQSYTDISRDIGLTPTTLSKWARKSEPRKSAFLPVHIRETEEPPKERVETTISITSPHGWLIQGLDVHALTAIIGCLK